MIGFFEHQYLSYKKNHLQNLIALAKADGHLHDDEEKLIYRIGQKYGLKDRQVASLILSKKKYNLHIPENHEDKMNQIYDLLLMVHADGVVDDHEVHFCEQIAEKYELQKEVIPWLLQYFRDDKRPVGPEWDKIIEESEKFEKKKATS
ncbi:MAG: hypothetical protein ACNS60_14695 [Candidatus Cyclobacteriaceae bacterium M2_1C_046]